ncbi:unnamed protein product [Trichogramma brassicae]|uniref:Uncharacterized protein n=1 Tax=Trichogramma brassicae TaxID=86971 RepID=A0A6H5I507_9HYME|nr:unnamed protein product [Trichogramma brassicae]
MTVKYGLSHTSRSASSHSCFQQRRLLALTATCRFLRATVRARRHERRRSAISLVQQYTAPRRRRPLALIIDASHALVMAAMSIVAISSVGPSGTAALAIMTERHSVSRVWRTILGVDVDDFNWCSYSRGLRCNCPDRLLVECTALATLALITNYTPRNSMVTTDLTLNITSKLQRLKNRFFKLEPPFFIADLKKSENFTSKYRIVVNPIMNQVQLLKKLPFISAPSPLFAERFMSTSGRWWPLLPRFLTRAFASELKTEQSGRSGHSREAPSCVPAEPWSRIRRPLVSVVLASDFIVGVLCSIYCQLCESSPRAPTYGYPIASSSYSDRGFFTASEADDIARVFFLSGTRSTSGTGSTTPGE